MKPRMTWWSEPIEMAKVCKKKKMLVNLSREGSPTGWSSGGGGGEQGSDWMEKVIKRETRAKERKRSDSGCHMIT